MKSSCDWLIVRPIFLYGWNYPWGRDNWVTKIIKRLKAGQEVKLVTDSYTQPTYAYDVAKYIWHMVENSGPNNRYMKHNVAGPDILNLYGFGRKVKEVFDLKGTIAPVKSEAFNIAKRPVDTTFESDMTDCHSVEEGLKAMKDER